MVKHIIMWDFPEEYTQDQRKEAASSIKEALEGLKGVIEGLVDIKVITEPLVLGSSADIMLDSTLEDEAALAHYQEHAAHQNVAGNIVRPNTTNRRCMDYVEF